MRKTTPGPWKAVFDQDGKQNLPASKVDTSRYFTSFISADKGRLHVAVSDYAMKEDAANFVLMAAAPEMLEALELMSNLMVDLGRINDYKACDVMLKAIAKAKGEG